MKKSLKRMHSSKRATRRDVAAAAGVSLTTVTHALTDTPGTCVNAATRDRVRQAAKELNYNPSFVGKALVTGKNYLAGLLQPSHLYLTFPLYQNIISALDNAMGEDDYNIVSLFMDDKKRYLKPVNQRRLDCVFVLQSDINTEHLENILETGIPAVVINRPTDIEKFKVSCVQADHRKHVDDAVADFIGLGCKSILFINNYKQCAPNMEMFEEFSEVINNNLDKGVTGINLLPSSDNFELQMDAIFNSGQNWDGIFVVGIGAAEKVLQAAKKHGLKANDDFHLIISEMKPDVRTKTKEEYCVYSQQPEKMGTAAWELMKNMLEGKGYEKRLIPYVKQLVNPTQTKVQ